MAGRAVRLQTLNPEIMPNKTHTLGVVAGLCLGGLACTAAAAAPPNILFIAVDDLRTGVGAYGDPVAITPHLDALAARGVLFERAFVQQALCNPSRASMLTGLRPDTLQVWNLPTHFRETQPDVVTLPQLFRTNGYFTQGIGKIFHNWRTKIAGDPASWSVPEEMHFATHGQDVPMVEGDLPENTVQTPGTEARDVPDEAYYDGRVAALAEEALAKLAATGEPFFLGVGFWKPHTPFNAPKRYWDLYRREDIPPVTSAKLPAGAPDMAGHPPFEGLGKAAVDDAAIQELRHGYYAATSYVDAQVGKVIAALDAHGLTESTIIVFWSDHGLHLGEHDLWGKTSNYELDLRVPLMVVAPGVTTPGTRAPGVVELLDIYPTLAELAGLPVAPELEGVSLRPVLADVAVRVRTAAFSQHPRPSHTAVPGAAMGYSLREERYRYTEWRAWTTGEVLAVELYDYAEAEVETRNLAGAAGLAAEQARFASELASEFPPGPIDDSLAAAGQEGSFPAIN